MAAISFPDKRFSFKTNLYTSFYVWFIWGFNFGIAGGLVATAYYYLLEACLHLVWHTLPDFLTPKFTTGFSDQNYVWIVTTIGGLLVGLTLHFMGLPGEVSMVVDKVHDPGCIEIRQTPAMIVASLFSWHGLHDGSGKCGNYQNVNQHDGDSERTFWYGNDTSDCHCQFCEFPLDHTSIFRSRLSDRVAFCNSSGSKQDSSLPQI